MKSKILCIGELLIDFICSDINEGLDAGVNFIKKAGGAPANVAVAISRLGGKAMFAGCVGRDFFGKYLKDILVENNVDVSMLKEDADSSTTLAFVSLKSDGERDFMFNRGSDEQYSYQDLDENSITSSRIIHFGSATALLGGALKDTYFKAMKLARDNNIFVSVDPNYRIDLWKGRTQEFINLSAECIRNADLVKVSDEELRLISGKEDFSEAVDVFHKLGARIVAVTLGKDGTFVSNGVNKETVSSIRIHSIDSTGAGDAFVGAFLYKLAEQGDPYAVIDDFDKIKEIAGFANKVGAIACTRMGAISAIPTLEEVKQFQ